MMFGKIVKLVPVWFGSTLIGEILLQFAKLNQRFGCDCILAVIVVPLVLSASTRTAPNVLEMDM